MFVYAFAAEVAAEEREQIERAFSRIDIENRLRVKYAPGEGLCPLDAMCTVRAGDNILRKMPGINDTIIIDITEEEPSISVAQSDEVHVHLYLRNTYIVMQDVAILIRFGNHA